MYFLVEGRGTEMRVYPKWVNAFLPKLPFHNDYESFKSSDNGFYLMSGDGYPSILNEIDNAIVNVNNIGNVDYLFIVLDCDEDCEKERYQEVINKTAPQNLNERTEIKVIIQKRCFETILLGNRKVIPRNSNNAQFVSYFNYHDVTLQDPELMGNFSDDFTHSQFHAEYLRKALMDKRIKYSKGNPKAILCESFTNELIKRVKETDHLPMFQNFVGIMEEISLKHRAYA
ncbi:hypothetical protein [Pseudoalteromonas sp. T1lg122]|uniref:hypothetical protein n=1 Tax=Pseudoalteromonas sp. T1lg122 TaxID=2077094 RepID=UPI001319CB5E|nr:hypothetical protein [Pseudoalteromonas sp. T1lg122]